MPALRGVDLALSTQGQRLEVIAEPIRAAPPTSSPRGPE
jgi:hypothetical protein